MAANKEAIAIVLDVGPSMNQAPPGVATPLETALQAITMILQRKMFAESKDEIALILIGTEDTDNPLADDETYQNISIANPLGIVDFDFLQLVQNDIKASTVTGDFLDGIVVAMDHLMNQIQGKKGIGSKRLILMSDLGAEFGDDQVDTIIASIKNSDTELNVIGPDLDDGDGDGDGGGGDGGASGGKPKTPQQRSGEAMVQHILQEVDGQCYSFNEALPMLSYFQSRQVKPTAWKCPLEIGPELKIPINGYVKVKDYKTKQSWKQVYAKDPTMEVGRLRTFHKTDEEETEVDKEDMVEGHRYGNTLVPMTDDDKTNMKYKAEKCFKVLGFTKRENIKTHELMGDGCMAVVAEKGDEAATVALSALINALYETNMCAVARRVYDARSSPRVGCLIPHIKAEYECLYWFELPFMEDVRQFTFGSLPIKEENQTNKQFKPSEEQLSAVDSLITSMDLGTAAEDEDGSCEALKPKLTFNPHFQRLYQCLQHRALNPDDPLPDLSPVIENYMKPPAKMVSQCSDSLDTISKKFKLEVVKKKENKTGETMFQANAENGEPAAKKLKVDDSLGGGLEDIAKAAVTKVGSTTPIEDFLALISQKDEDKFDDACSQMQKHIERIVLESFGDQFYSKALDCLKCLREQCVKKLEAKAYNTFVKAFKDTLVAKARKDFFDKMVDDKQCLITKLECEDGASEEEAKDFSSDTAADTTTEPTQEDSAEDLMDEL